jgi:hypothetical protein
MYEGNQFNHRIVHLADCFQVPINDDKASVLPLNACLVSMFNFSYIPVNILTNQL